MREKVRERERGDNRNHVYGADIWNRFKTSLHACVDIVVQHITYGIQYLQHHYSIQETMRSPCPRPIQDPLEWWLVRRLSTAAQVSGQGTITAILSKITYVCTYILQMCEANLF